VTRTVVVRVGRSESVVLSATLRVWCNNRVAFYPGVPRGFETADFVEVSDVIARALHPAFSAGAATELAARVAALADRHPLYRSLAPAC